MHAGKGYCGFCGWLLRFCFGGFLMLAVFCALSWDDVTWGLTSSLPATTHESAGVLLELRAVCSPDLWLLGCVCGGRHAVTVAPLSGGAPQVPLARQNGGALG